MKPYREYLVETPVIIKGKRKFLFFREPDVKFVEKRYYKDKECKILHKYDGPAVILYDRIEYWFDGRKMQTITEQALKETVSILSQR